MVKTRKIFCFGLPKTGTTSLGSALKILGFKHKSWDRDLNEKYNQGDYEPIFREAENYDSFDDGPWNRDEFYKELDKRFPDSKFILTVRDPKKWIESYETHFMVKFFDEKPLKAIQVWEYSFQEVLARKYSEKRKARLLAWQKKHTENTLEYFQDRLENLLVINICDGEGWEKLCPFLKVPMPIESFPVTNVTRKRNLSTLGIWKSTLDIWKKKITLKPSIYRHR
jgi:hypothetical protein